MKYKTMSQAQVEDASRRSRKISAIARKRFKINTAVTEKVIKFDIGAS